MSVVLYIAGNVADQFGDESIQLQRQAKDLQDIGRLYADYSKPFTLPATDRNNEIFSHYYELDIAVPYDAHTKVVASIDVDGIRIFDGVLELMSVDLLENEPNSYEVVFYGQITQLTTLWGDDTFQDVDYNVTPTLSYSQYTSDWVLANGLTPPNVLAPVFDYGGRETGTWTYDTSSVAQNSIGLPDANGGDGVSWHELRPALNFKYFLEQIFAHIGYDVTFETDLFADKLYILPMEREGYLSNINFDGTFAASRSSTFTIAALGSGVSYGYTQVQGLTQLSDPSNSFDPTNGIYTPKVKGNYDISVTLTGIQSVTSGSVNVFMIDPVTNHTAFSVFHAVNTGFVGATTKTFNVSSMLRYDRDYELRIRNTAGVQQTIDSIDWSITRAPDVPSAVPDYDMRDSMPDVKIADWMSQFVKAFNLVLIPSTGNVTIKKHTTWLSEGTTRDFTAQVDSQRVVLRKHPLPERVHLKHKESDDIANAAFRNAEGRNFGEVVYDLTDFDFNGEAIEVESPVTIMPISNTNEVSGTRITGTTDLEVAYFVNDKGSPIQIPFSLWYFVGYQNSQDWYMYNDSGNDVKQTQFPYFRHVEDYTSLSSTTDTLTYSQEVVFYVDGGRTWAVPENTLYKDLWQSYIDSVYNPKMRIVEVSMYLEIGQYMELQLNDSIVISGRGYKIDKISYDSQTGEAKLTLYTYLQRVRPLPTISVDDTSNQVTATWSDPPSRTDMTLYNVHYNRTTGRYQMHIPRSTSQNYMPIVRGDLFRQKGEALFRPQLALLLKTTTSTYSVGNTYVTIDDYQTYDSPPSLSYTDDLSNGDLQLNEDRIVMVQASIELDEQSNHDLVFAIMLDDVATHFVSFVEKDDHNVNLVGTFEVGMNQNISLAMKTLEDHTSSVDIIHVAWVTTAFP